MKIPFITPRETKLLEKRERSLQKEVWKKQKLEEEFARLLVNAKMRELRDLNKI